MARHNKKRNVGLIYELLIQRLSKAVVEGDKKKIDTVQQIIQKRFKKGTELHREFRLFNALVTTQGVSEALAYRILNEARTASADHNPEKLDREKSLLIKDVNHKINETTFYDKKIKNYQVYASAQQLFNMWRDKDENIVEVARHEAKVHEWLIKESDSSEINEHLTPTVNDLTVKVMEGKFEKKYGNALNSDQKSLLKLYCEGNDQKLKCLIEELTNTAGALADRYTKNTADKFLVEKVTNTKNTIVNNKIPNSVDGVSKAMMIAQLIGELKEFENVKG